MAAVTLTALLCVSPVSASAATLVAVDLADTVDKAAPSVVEVFTETKRVSPFYQEYVTEGAGSGVVLTADGYIVTNHHVIDGASAVRVRLSGGDTRAATLIGTDSKTDLAVLKIEAANLVPAKLSDSSRARVGGFVIAIGNPLGELGGSEDIPAVLDRHSVGDTVKVTVSRGGREASVSVRLTEKKAA